MNVSSIAVSISCHSNLLCACTCLRERYVIEPQSTNQIHPAEIPRSTSFYVYASAPDPPPPCEGLVPRLPHCLPPHTAKMVVVDTIWQLHTFIVMNSWYVCMYMCVRINFNSSDKILRDAHKSHVCGLYSLFNQPAATSIQRTGEKLNTHTLLHMLCHLHRRRLTAYAYNMSCMQPPYRRVSLITGLDWTHSKILFRPFQRRTEAKHAYLLMHSL